MTDNQKDKIRKMRSGGVSYSKIAEFLCISVNTVQSFCQRNGLGSGGAQKSMEMPDDENCCKQCGKHLVQVSKQKPKKFCSKECRHSWWNANRDKLAKKTFYEFTCKGCGVPFKSYGNRKRKYCSHKCYAADKFQ